MEGRRIVCDLTEEEKECLQVALWNEFSNDVEDPEDLDFILLDQSYHYTQFLVLIRMKEAGEDRIYLYVACREKNSFYTNIVCHTPYNLLLESLKNI